MSESPHPHNSDRNLLIEYSECNGNFLGWIGVQRTILWLTQFFGKAKYNSIDWRMWQHSTSLMTLITPIELLNRREFQRPPAISFDLSSIIDSDSESFILRNSKIMMSIWLENTLAMICCTDPRAIFLGHAKKFWRDYQEASSCDFYIILNEWESILSNKFPRTSSLIHSRELL